MFGAEIDNEVAVFKAPNILRHFSVKRLISLIVKLIAARIAKQANVRQLPRLAAAMAATIAERETKLMNEHSGERIENNEECAHC